MFVKGDLREYSRTYFVRQLRYSLNTHNTKEDISVYGTAVSVDISRGGIGIFTTYPLNEGQVLTFERRIKTQDVQAQSAVVKWSGKIDGDRYRVGLKFI